MIEAQFNLYVSHYFVDLDHLAKELGESGTTLGT